MKLTVQLVEGAAPQFKSANVVATAAAWEVVGPLVRATIPEIGDREWEAADVAEVLGPVAGRLVELGFTEFEICDGETVYRIDREGPTGRTLRQTAPSGGPDPRPSFDDHLAAELERTGKAPSAEMRGWLRRAFEAGQDAATAEFRGAIRGLYVSLAAQGRSLMAQLDEVQRQAKLLGDLAGADEVEPGE